MNENRSALVVLSGGQDSTTCLYWAIAEGYHPIHAITFAYGQRHEAEIEAAKKVAELAKVTSHGIVDLPDVLRSRSPLVDHESELETYESFRQMDQVIGDRIELTFVPLRNALFATIAANRALQLGCNRIVMGVCESDNANYPDCREAFLSAQQQAIREAIGVATFELCAPLVSLDKPAICKLGRALPGCWEALAYTHTAYDGQYPPTGKDHASVLRAQGFEQAGLPDPLVLRAHREGLMELPQTPNYAGGPL